jgi:hypothetical protein
MRPARSMSISPVPAGRQRCECSPTRFGNRRGRIVMRVGYTRPKIMIMTLRTAASSFEIDRSRYTSLARCDGTEIAET